MTGPAIIWFRRDLRLHDLPTLLSAADRSDDALALFVLDDALLRPSGAPRREFLFDSLRALDASMAGRLLVVRGTPSRVLPRVADGVSADSVHISADYGPYGAERDAAVEEALGTVPLIRTGSPYAVAPGRIRTKAGAPYRVFTPYRRAWLDHGWRPPALTGPNTVRWQDPPDGLFDRVRLDKEPAAADPVPLPAGGEAAASARWQDFLAGGLDHYADLRNRPAADGTSRMSPYLKFGCVHPRTLLHDLSAHNGHGAESLRSELAWRDFYADVLHHRPDTARGNYHRRFDHLRYDGGPDGDAAFDAWSAGRTGFPIVDAGMRQLRGEGWMHNRVRMIVASFLTKDLHLPWWRGARHFLRYLVDGDLASNQHGWQWVAGCGTDAVPYFRVFNPTTQGLRFDPDGDYVRRWVPELRGIAGSAVHRLPHGPPEGYPTPIVDHKEERIEALARYGELPPAG